MEELKASITREIDCISEIELIYVNAHILKKMPEMEDISNISFIRYVIIFLCNFTQL